MKLLCRKIQKSNKLKNICIIYNCNGNVSEDILFAMIIFIDMEVMKVGQSQELINWEYFQIGKNSYLEGMICIISFAVIIHDTRGYNKACKK